MPLSKSAFRSTLLKTGEVMNGAEIKFGGLAIAFGLIGYLIYENIADIMTVVGLILLIAAIAGGIFIYFWQRSTRRSEHPWN